jgi:hypothetical protein
MSGSAKARAEQQPLQLAHTRSERQHNTPVSMRSSITRRRRVAFRDVSQWLCMYRHGHWHGTGTVPRQRARGAGVVQGPQHATLLLPVQQRGVVDVLGKFATRFY